MGRSPCCDKAHTNKGAWTREEDQRLIAFIQANGQGCWRTLPKAAGLLRCGKSCRLRWINYLRPDLRRGNFTPEEDDLIIELHSLLGNKWSLIASRLPGRTDNEIKNYWNTHIRRKLLSRGIDPSTNGLVKGSVLASIMSSIDELSKEEDAPCGEKVNLELKICPPFQQKSDQVDSGGKKVSCFYCSLGLRDKKECRCCGGGNTHDFLQVKNGVLDCRR